MIRSLAVLSLAATLSSCSNLDSRLKDEPESHHRSYALELLAQDPVEDAQYAESAGITAWIGGFGGVIMLIGLEDEDNAHHLGYDFLRDVNTRDPRINHLQSLLVDPDGFPLYPFNNISTTQNLYHEARIKYATLFRIF